MRILFLNQCFYPDVVATAQQLTSLARGLVERGHDVTVIAGDRGYDDSSIRFPRRELWDGINIIRVPALSFGKAAKWSRALNFASFFVNCSLKLLWLPRCDVVVALTSPPLISVLGSLFVRLRGGRFFVWVMDLNPDEAIAAGWLKAHSLAARILGAFERYSLQQTEKTIVLDRFMKQRVEARGLPAERIAVLAPWALNEQVSYDAKARDEFRARHNLANSFVVMYSGNHSPCHPLDTLLEAARHLSSRDDIRFCFVGGGTEKTKPRAFAEANNLRNITCLPYQALNELSGSLSAADLHAVVMGEAFAGIVHPCKVYNILTLGTPFLYIGPKESHISDLANQCQNGYRVYRAQHGEVKRVVDCIVAAADGFSSPETQNVPQIADRYRQEALLPKMIHWLEAANSERK